MKRSPRARRGPKVELPIDFGNAEVSLTLKLDFVGNSISRLLTSEPVMEDIREASYSGNLVSLRNLVEYLGVDVNERHKMNGTTRPCTPFSNSFLTTQAILY